jgi:nucleotide-binding universal stress UspA family protein
MFREALLRSQTRPREREAQVNILVATDGTLDPRQAADAVARWFVEGDVVGVFTTLSVPTDFLRGLGDSGVKEAARIAQEAGATLGAGDRAAERLIGSMKKSERSKVDSPVLHAMASSAAKRMKPVVDALKDQGIEAKASWRTSEGKTANTVLRKVRDFEADLLVIGSHGQGQYEGLLGSTGTKLVRLAPASVLVLRNPTARPGQVV